MIEIVYYLTTNHLVYRNRQISTSSRTCILMPLFFTHSLFGVFYVLSFRLSGGVYCWVPAVHFSPPDILYPPIRATVTNIFSNNWSVAPHDSMACLKLTLTLQILHDPLQWNVQFSTSLRGTVRHTCALLTLLFHPPTELDNPKGGVTCTCTSRALYSWMWPKLVPETDRGFSLLVVANLFIYFFWTDNIPVITPVASTTLQQCF